MSQLYREQLLEHGRSPRHFGRCDAITHSSRATNASCGDVIELTAQVDATGRVLEAKFIGQGCVISQAAASLVLIEIQGRSTTDILAMSQADVLKLLGIAPGPLRLNCALLIRQALHKALC